MPASILKTAVFDVRHCKLPTKSARKYFVQNAKSNP